MRKAKALAAVTATAALLLTAPAPFATAAEPTPPDQAARAVVRATPRQQVIALTNVARRAHGCHRLRGNAALGRAAQRHTKRMARAEELSHQLPGEAYFSTRITRAGYRNWTLVGENVAYGYLTPAAVVDAWMASPGHRRNILNCRYQHIGVGLARASDGTPYWTQDFGRK